jgi:tetratricopeptide (TPR) repeat protein
VSTPLEEQEAQNEVGEANVLFSLGLREESEQHFLMSLSICETTVAHYNIAVLYHATGRQSEAIESYRRALVLDADFQPARENLQLLGKAF